ncbi:hypothetical protein DT019_24695 [Streptomyces sp. SDr-06]|uniref:DUF4097 family beta strand repeat-containing protein n=1 Tax=Streptomyces sp. SDr-06 TaxID=2267702 RepID=UPI000DEC0262|nr:DUF4097 family beta strand repeat-containing protein [Streptomyces sp. SDr-06]RCH66022.1 hypothetical protein DT019_24695 [Streptomyces sp. SDr-06]
MSTTRLRIRTLAAVTLTALAAGALGACGPLDDKTFKDDATVKERITAVRLDGHSDGFRVRGKKDPGKVSVHREVNYRGKTKPEGTTYRVENGVLVLEGCGKNCSVDYTVDVPAGIPVTGSSTEGTLSLSSVGEVKVSTKDGDVRVSGATGPVDIGTTNGSISGNGLKGTGVTARTSNGSISLTPDTVQDVTAQTSNGSISVTAPSAPYHVSARTSRGATKLGIPDAPTAAHQLNLTTSNGDITLKASK